MLWLPWTILGDDTRRQRQPWRSYIRILILIAVWLQQAALQQLVSKTVVATISATVIHVFSSCNSIILEIQHYKAAIPLVSRYTSLWISGGVTERRCNDHVKCRRFIRVHSTEVNNLETNDLQRQVFVFCVTITKHNTLNLITTLVWQKIS